MKWNYAFDTDEDSRRFCDEIVLRMVHCFSLDELEAVGRINRQWLQLPFIGSEDIRYHDDVDYWAHRIYYEDSVNWWVPGTQLIPKKFP